VGWFDRGRRASTGPEPGDDEPSGPSPEERAAPALEALFEGLEPDGSHAILDMGTANQPNLEFLSRFAERIRFAGLVPPGPGEAAELGTAVRALPPDPERPYDVVLLWNLLDLLGPGQRKALIGRLTRLTAPGSRLYAVVDPSAGSTVQPLRFTLSGPDRVVQEPVGSPEAAGPPLLPAQATRVLEPFRVVRAFTLRIGAREYLAAREEEEEREEEGTSKG